MLIYYTAILLTIISNVFYHIFAKSTPGDVNPVLSLLFTYLTAAASCLLLIPLYSNGEGIGIALRRVNWTSYALGISIVGLELGFLLAYRAGWNISMAGIISNGTVALLLIPIGLFAFHERLNVFNVVGIIMCLVGFILMNKR